MANRIKQLLSNMQAPNIVKPLGIKTNTQVPLYGDTLALQAQQANTMLSNAQAAQYRAQAANQTLAAMRTGVEPQVVPASGGGLNPRLQQLIDPVMKKYGLI